MAKASPTGAEVTFDNAPRYDDEALLNITDFNAAVALATQELGGEILSVSDEIGNGFTILNGDDKMQLVGLPCMFMGWTFNVGEQGKFVSVTTVAKGAGGALIKAIVNDGGTGIHDQLEAYTARTGKQGGLTARKGLRASSYYYDEESGQTFSDGGPGRKKATTFYIDTSA